MTQPAIKPTVVIADTALSGEAVAAVVAVVIEQQPAELAHARRVLGLGQD